VTAPNASGYSCPPLPATASPAAPGIDAALPTAGPSIRAPTASYLAQ
jgi:hypothetical protein